MSKLQIIFNELASVAARTTVTNSDIGLRTIGGALTEGSSEGGGGLLGNILGGLLNIGGWILQQLTGGLVFGAKFILDCIVGTARFITHFNWNTTDEQLDQLLENTTAQLSGMLGGTVGNLLGWLVCGIGPGAAIFYFNESLGLKILRDVGEEALDEFLGNLKNLTTQATLGLIKASLVVMFKSGRRMLKSLGDNSGIGQFLNKIVGNKKGDLLKTWGEPGSKPWSFASQHEENLDKIENDNVRNFLEEGIEEFLDACVEAGYVVAQGIDDWVLKQQMMKEMVLGKERVVEVILDREIPDERIVIAGPEQVVKTTLTNTMAQYQLIENRDVGMITGETLRENLLRVKPPLTLLLQWAFYETPPFFRGARKRLLQCSIPGIKRSVLDWSTIKLAMGGANGYNWGRFKASARLVTDSDQRATPVILYAGSASEAEERLKALLTLSDYQIASFSVTEELKEGRKAQGRALYKDIARIYPAYMTLCNAQKVINETEGRTTLTGTYKSKRNRIEMFRDVKPYDFDEVIQEILSTPGADL